MSSTINHGGSDEKRITMADLEEQARHMAELETQIRANRKRSDEMDAELDKCVYQVLFAPGGPGFHAAE